jgi:hypothetical protein
LEWIDEANKQRAAIRDRERLIVEEEDATYDTLWAELNLHIEAAKQKGFPRLSVNGREQARIVVLSPDPDLGPNVEPQKLHVTLSKPTHEILTSAANTYGYSDATFHIDVCADGFVVSEV